MQLLSTKKGEAKRVFANLFHNKRDESKIAFAKIFSSKKAQTDMLHEALKTITGAMIFLLLASFAIDMYLIWTYTETTPEEKDFNRVAQELLTLQEGESFNVITSGENYAIHLYKAGEQSYKECRKTSCLCYSKAQAEYNSAGHSGTSSTSDNTIQKCQEIQISQNCEQGICLKKTGQNTHQIKKGEAVTICRKNNEILLEQCQA